MHYGKLGRRLKLIVPKYRPDPVSRLEDIPEKVYSTELKQIVNLGKDRNGLGSAWVSRGLNWDCLGARSLCKSLSLKIM